MGTRRVQAIVTVWDRLRHHREDGERRICRSPFARPLVVVGPVGLVLHPGFVEGYLVPMLAEAGGPGLGR